VTLSTERDGPIARVWLDRPDVRNALDGALIGALTATFRTLGEDGSVRAIVLGGRGKAFCAGADLHAMRASAAQTWQQNHADAEALVEMLWTLYRCPQPVIGRIHGDCIAGGVGLAAVCDVLVAAEPANFCLSEARLGLLPATIGPYVVRALGVQQARRYFVTAERFDARTAWRLGFVHEVCSTEALDETIAGIAATVVHNGPEAVVACKRYVQQLADVPWTDELRAESARRIADIRAGDEGREGLQSFLERRAPRWVLARPGQE
jgi:methylglutaconyl-CoA hydratase